MLPQKSETRSSDSFYFGFRFFVFRFFVKKKFVFIFFVVFLFLFFLGENALKTINMGFSFEDLDARNPTMKTVQERKCIK